MKKPLIGLALLALALFPPLYAQEASVEAAVSAEPGLEAETPAAAGDETEAEMDALAGDILETITDMNNPEGPPAGEQSEPQEGSFDESLQPDQTDKTKAVFARQHFEFGFGAGFGFDNNLMGTGDILKKNVVIDLNELNSKAGDSGVDINADVNGEIFHLDIMNIKAGILTLGIGFFTSSEGGINLNLPKSLFSLISDGNINQHSVSGTVSASGAVFAGAGLRAAAQWGKLRVGLKPGIFAPLAYIPKSGINYYIEAEDKLRVEAGGEISVYTPFVENGELQFGSDFALEGEYALFPFLDVGGGFDHIPLSGAVLKNRMRLTFNMDPIVADNLISGEEVKIPKFDSDELFKKTYDSVKQVTVHRPFRFDVYARYKPFNNEFIVVRPNIGFSVDINNAESYFNAGLAASLNLSDVFILNLGSGYEDAIWRQRAGFALNCRVFEFDLEAVFRSRDFAGSFQGQGMGVNLGLRFGY